VEEKLSGNRGKDGTRGGEILSTRDEMTRGDEVEGTDKAKEEFERGQTFGVIGMGCELYTE
jgi:hypothetical protein